MNEYKDNEAQIRKDKIDPHLQKLVGKQKMESKPLLNFLLIKDRFN